MKQLLTIAFGLLILTRISFAQTVNPDCPGFNATYSTKESRCASTGSITITPSGGSGNYSYKIVAPVTMPMTSSSTITGLAPGSYTVHIKDMINGCTIIKENIIVNGSYSDPRFQLTKIDPSCINGTNGAVSVTDFQNGRSPFTFKIISPSPAGVGTSNTTGSFNSLKAGEYYIQLTDSCGGLQTRSVSLVTYNWSITNSTVPKLNCNTIYVNIPLLDTRGNTNQSGTAFSGFQYGLINAPGDTAWQSSSAFTITRSPLRKISIAIKDLCGVIKLANWQNQVPSLDADVTISNTICSTFDVKVTNAQNLVSPQYYLKRGSVTVQSNSTGKFTNIPYGTYCLEAKDNCYDTTISRCFTQTAPVPSVNTYIDTFNTQCNAVSIKIAGQTNLFNPTYNLYNSANALVGTNTTGTFNNVQFGAYCMKIVSANPCYDTTISRCFTLVKPKPSVSTPNFWNFTCSNYIASVNNPINLFNPTYCLYQGDLLISCNSTGTFPYLNYGVNYCIKIKSGSPCYDTTITQCFNRSQPTPSVSNPTFSNKTCSSFTVTIPGVSYIPNPKYCLYTSNDLLVACNTTGVFNNVPYGNNYYIEVVTTATNTDCLVMTVTKTFSLQRTSPTVANQVTISNKGCTTFNAQLENSDMIGPKFLLFNNNGVLINTNTTGVFNNLTYGSYTLMATTSCLDTFVRTFSEYTTPISVVATASESCTALNTTDIKAIINSGQGPFIIKVINPLNNVIASQTVTGTSYTFTGLPALTGSLQYRLAFIPSCGFSDTIAITPKPSQFSRANIVSLKCPNGLFANGSGNFTVDLNSNLGLYAPKIIKKDGATVTIAPTITTNLTTTSRRYVFQELSPASYVVEYVISSCTKNVYDTITIAPYSFPDLKNSAAYQCDNKNFTVSAVASGGVAPFKYEIIGSFPASPSIITAVQTNSLFNISTVSPYSLVRMRAVDNCGNGTLNDVSVLPLGQLTIRVDNVDCYSNNLTLTVDTVPNASYNWYLKKRINSTDSTLVTSSQAYYIPYLLPTDTGTYVCKTAVNGGCLQRLSYFNLKGDCSIILPVKITSFTGKLSGNDAILNWSVAQEDGIKEYQVERSIGNAVFQYIGTVSATNNPSRNQYTFTDHNAPGGKIKYRLKIVEQNNGQSYSKIIDLTHNAVFITAAPNPVKQELSISISAKTDAAYSIKLFNLSGQVIYQQTTNRVRSGVFRIQRNGKMPSGFYLVKVLNLESGEEFTEKLIFE